LDNGNIFDVLFLFCFECTYIFFSPHGHRCALIKIVTWMHSFPLICLWFIYQNVSNSIELWNNTRRYEMLPTLNLGCSFQNLFWDIYIWRYVRNRTLFDIHAVLVSSWLLYRWTSPCWFWQFVTAIVHLHYLTWIECLAIYVFTSNWSGFHVNTLLKVQPFRIWRFAPFKYKF
jgi:hypothetical protein